MNKSKNFNSLGAIMSKEASLSFTSRQKESETSYPNFFQKDGTNYNYRRIKINYYPRTNFELKEQLIIKNKIRLIREFEAEKDRLGNKSVFESSDLEKVISDLIQEVISKGVRIGLELTSSNSIFFTIMKASYEIHMELFIEHLNENKEVLFTIYHNDEIIVTGWDNVKNATREIKKVITESDTVVIDVLS